MHATGTLNRASYARTEPSGDVFVYLFPPSGKVCHLRMGSPTWLLVMDEIGYKLPWF